MIQIAIQDRHNPSDSNYEW